MPAPPTKRQRGTLSLQAAKAPGAWQAFLLPLSAFPTPEEELAAARQWLQKLSAAFVRQQKLTAEVFIQMDRLHLGDGVDRFCDHAVKWLPASGLGVWPDREPPTLWTDDEFKNLGEGEQPRTFMYQVFHIGGPSEAREQARDVMLGLGTVLEMLTADETGALLKKCRDLLLPPIQDRAFKNFPLYVPLLEGRSVAEASAEQLDAWTCGASVYIRESNEDHGILLLSKEPLDSILEAIGCERDGGKEASWRIPG